jgi:D-glycero-D-manno-heptose 1,7-bisphosphate phosphatase
MSRPAILLDRDGTLNDVPDYYVKSLSEFVPVQGVFAALGRLFAAGWPLFVCTNQSGVGLGVVEPEIVGAVHAECARLAAEHGATFAGFYVCPHRPDEGCTCRKPLPGLLLTAAADHGLDLFRSYCIGDSLRDLQAGRAAGAMSLLVLTGRGEEARAEHPAELTFPSLVEAADWILTRGGSRRAGAR